MSRELYREGGAEPSSSHPRTLGRTAQGQASCSGTEDSPLQTHTPAPVSSGVPGTGSYLMELSDETSRSESSVSLGGGGGSLSGTAVKAGDFLEKNTRCHFGPSRKKNKTPPVTLGQAGRLLRFLSLLCRGTGGCQARTGEGRLFQLDEEQCLSYLGGSERLSQRSEESEVTAWRRSLSHTMALASGPTGILSGGCGELFH